MVSWTPNACAMAIFVPTPSVEVASRGRRMPSSAEASTMPAKPPVAERTVESWVRETADFISSTARSPAAVSTPAEA